jgi:hypothetical protein
MGGSLGLAVMSTIAAAGTGSDGGAEALTDGYALAFRASTALLVGGAVLMRLWLPRAASAAVAKSSTGSAAKSSAG